MSVLILFYNEILKYGSVPDSFRNALIFPLHKQGDVSVVNNFRGICFQNSLYKILSALLHFRLNLWLNQHNPISETQAGFRKGYSTLDHVYTIDSLIKLSFKRQAKLFCFFIDFKAAFDSINHKALFYKLALLVIGGN